MYTPSAFARSDPSELYAFVEAYSFGLLVSTENGVPIASHLPFLLERNSGPSGSLVGHMARANPQWQHLNGKPVLVVFSGPHTYVSPSWYEAENLVPTWNYVAVHATGIFRTVEVAESQLAILAATVQRYEAAMPTPWQIDAKSDSFRQLVRAIVGFKIEIVTLEGKWKLSQNQPPERRAKVARALELSSDADALAIAKLMRENG